ncbi:E3 SUMO-protein ligase ZBED1-like [Stigmatopora nigra]
MEAEGDGEGGGEGSCGSSSLAQVKTEPKSEEDEDEEEEGEDEPEELLPKRGNRSSTVWLWFGFRTSDVEQKTVICKTCRRQIATSDSNTSNLFYHLKTRHEALYLESLRIRDHLPLRSNGGHGGQGKGHKGRRKEPSPNYDEQSRRHRDITEAICRFLVSEERLCVASPDTVRRRGFRELIRTLEPRYALPEAKHFTEVQLPRMYEECRAEVAEELREADYYALTCGGTPPYVGLTVHFVDRHWILRSRRLQTGYLPQERPADGADGVASLLREVLHSWDLRRDMLVCVTADHAAAIEEGCEWNGLQCFGLHLQTAVEMSLKTCSPSQAAVSDAVGMCKQVTAAISNSLKRRCQLAKAQVDLNVPIQHLKTENPWRWGSRQQMIGRFLQQEKAVKQVLMEDGRVRHLTPSRQDMQILEAINLALSPLKEFTDAFSGGEYIAVSYVRPVLHLFRNQILKPQHHDPPLTSSIKEGILGHLVHAYARGPGQRLLDAATLLDPRFKSAYLDPERLDGIRSGAAAEMELLMAGVRAEVPSPPAERPEPPGPPGPPAKKAKRSLSSYFKKAAAACQPDRASAELELDTYLRTADLDPEKDPLEWWRRHEVNFPWVARLAKKYLCVPATSFPSERIFGAGGDARVPATAGCAKPHRVDQLLFLSANRRNT